MVPLEGDTPEWAALLGGDYPRFRDIVRAEATRLAIAFDDAHLDCGVLRSPSSTYGLTNVVRLCRGEPVERWPEIIGDHLRRCTAKAVPLAFDVVAPRLRLRLVPGRHVDAQPTRYVTRGLASDLHLALAIDKPEHVVFVAADEPATWERSVDDLFDRALANTRDEPALERTDLDVAGAPPISVLHGPSYYAASHAVFLERYLAPGVHGHLVAVPDRHAILAVALDGAEGLSAIGPLVRLAHARFTEEPGAISDQLYWRLPDGALRRIACGVRDDGEVWVAPPEDFTRRVVGA